ncbi:stage II sporulation protein M [Bacillus sp. 2205SS5-2]|uniref:stage II sporulation protein M n=1 Tax=Bacillus sp. 2205SS5-2 TaxID=3109031 RepID=UPI003003C401
MKKRYQREWRNFKDHYAGHFITSYLLLLGSALASFWFIQFLPIDINEFFSQIQEKFQKISNQNSDSAITWTIFLNNMRVSAMIMVLGLIPIIILPHFLLLVNGVIIGVVLHFVKASGVSLFPVIVFGLAPHGITELTGFVYAASIGAFVGVNIWRIVFKHKKAVSFKDSVLMSINSFLFVVFPLILVSALIEGYLTSLLLERFM